MSEDRSHIAIEELKEIPAVVAVPADFPDGETRLSQFKAFFKTLAEALPSGCEPALFWEKLMIQVAKETHADIAFLFEYNEAPQEWSLRASFGMPNTFGKGGILSRAWQSLPTIISQEKPILFSEDVTKDRRFVGQMIRGTSVRSFLGATSQADGVIKSLCIGHNAPDAQTEADRAFFIELSKALCSALIDLQVSNPTLFQPCGGSGSDGHSELSGPNRGSEPSVHEGSDSGDSRGERTDPQQAATSGPAVTIVAPARDPNEPRTHVAVNRQTPSSSIENSPTQERVSPVSLPSTGGNGGGVSAQIVTPPASRGDNNGRSERSVPPRGAANRPASQGSSRSLVTDRQSLPAEPPVVVETLSIPSLSSAERTSQPSRPPRPSSSSAGVGSSVVATVSLTGSPAPATPPTPVAPLALSDVKSRVLEALFSSLTSVFHGEDFSKEILKKIVSVMEADIAYLLRWDQGNQRLFPVASEGVLPEIAKRMERSGIKPDPIWGKVIDRHQPLLLTFENWKSPLKKRLCGEELLRFQMTVPIRCGNETWGILSLFHRSNVYTQKELKLLESVGEKIGQAFAAVTHWEHLHKKIATLTMAQNFSQIMARGVFDLSSLLDGIKTAVAVSNVYLFLCDTNRSVISGCAASGPTPTSIQEFEIRMEENTICPLTVKQGHPLIVENAPSDSRVDKRWLDWFRSRSLFSIPLILQGRVIGLLVLDETAYFRRFTEEEIQTTVALSYPAAFSITAALQYQEALAQRERQEAMSIAILRINEEERSRMATAVGHGTVEILEKVRRGITALSQASQDARSGRGSQTAQVSERPGSLPTESRKLLEESDLMLKKSIEEMKALSSDIYPDLLEKQGLMATIRGYTETFSKATGIPVQLKTPSTLKRSSLGMDMLLYRIIQEAFCNVSKHANAKTVVLSIDRKEVYWQMSITDDGKGFDARRHFAFSQIKRRGVGIVGMKGRVEMMGGTFYIESEPQSGTRVSVKIPITTKEIL